MTMEFINHNVTQIPASVWIGALLPLMQDGYQLKICPAGRSMIPFLRGGRDEAVLSVPGSGYTFKKNDVVLYQIESGLYVLHRICRITSKGYYTLGDGNTGIEGPFQREDFIAVVEYIIRKGRVILKGDYRYLLLVRLWRLIRPLRPFVIRQHAVLRRIWIRKRL